MSIGIGFVELARADEGDSVMRRRAFLAASVAMLTAPLAVQAQTAKIFRVGWLVFGNAFSEASPGLEPIVLRWLRELGYTDGQNLAIEYRYAEGQADRLSQLAIEMTRLRVDLLLGIGGDIAVAFKHATTSIPIVVATSNDPIRAQLAASLARPGGNLTGLTFVSDELAGKRVELLREVMPHLSRLGVIWDPTHVDNDFAEVQVASLRLGVQLYSLEVRGPRELDAAWQTALQRRVEAVIVVPGRLTAFLGKRIMDAAGHDRITVVSAWREFAEIGAVLTYGPDRVEGAKRLARYVDQVLKGAKPADLPIEQPTKFELVINLKTAKALGLTIPPAVLARADEVIQ
jgi:putative ABC transport system substrate-binding protein